MPSISLGNQPCVYMTIITIGTNMSLFSDSVITMNDMLQCSHNLYAA